MVSRFAPISEELRRELNELLPYISIAELSKRFGVHESWFYDIKNGRLKKTSKVEALRRLRAELERVKREVSCVVM